MGWAVSLTSNDCIANRTPEQAGKSIRVSFLSFVGPLPGKHVYVGLAGGWGRWVKGKPVPHVCHPGLASPVTLPSMVMDVWPAESPANTQAYEN
jgi:hypothetical protein